MLGWPRIFRPKPEQRPDCKLEIKEGERGRWRWTARSTRDQTVDGAHFKRRKVIAVDEVGGYTTQTGARLAGLAAMRGWRVVSVENVT